MATASTVLVVLPSLLSLLAMATSSDFASDQAECAGQLIGLATCLSYVEGSSAAPTPDCCAGLKRVVAKSFECLCVLIKDRNDPNLGFKVNVSLALLLPSKCKNAPANISDCPRVLNLPGDSEEAKVFEQFGKDLEKTGAAGKQGGSHDHEAHDSKLKAGGSSDKKSWLGYLNLFWTSSLTLHALLLMLGD